MPFQMLLVKKKDYLQVLTLLVKLLEIAKKIYSDL